LLEKKSISSIAQKSKTTSLKYLTTNPWEAM